MNINVSIVENEIKPENNQQNNKIIYNLIFAEKLIKELSLNKKRIVDINYFLSYINIFNKIKEEIFDIEPYDLNFIEYNVPKILKQDLKLLGDKPIELYDKKQIICYNKYYFIDKYNYHNSLKNISSKYYEFINFIFDNKKNIVGYIVLGKKKKKSTQNLCFILDKNYEKNFYTNINKKVCLMAEIIDEFNIYEKNTYNDYLKYYRDYLYSVLKETFEKYDNINNLVFIGNKKGANILELFLKDITENVVEKYFPNETIKLNSISYNIFKLNSSMLTNINFYEDLINKIEKDNYTYINCFDNKLLDYKSWNEFMKYYKKNDNINSIILERMYRKKKKDSERIKEKKV